MARENKLYVLDWGNGMIGIFKGSNLSQVMNNTKSMLAWSLKYAMELYDCNGCEVEFLESREQLNKLRIEKGLNKKPTFDEYLHQRYKNLNH